jgi:hypothetical protein
MITLQQQDMIKLELNRQLASDHDEKLNTE